MGRIYLDANGITVKGEGCEVGYVGYLNGELFEVVDNVSAPYSLEKIPK